MFNLCLKEGPDFFVTKKNKKCEFTISHIYNYICIVFTNTCVIFWQEREFWTEIIFLINK